MESGKLLPLEHYQDKNIFDFIKTVLSNLNLLSKDIYQSDEQAKTIFDNPALVLLLSKSREQKNTLLHLQQQLDLFKACRQDSTNPNYSEMHPELKIIFENDQAENKKIEKLLEQMGVDGLCSEVENIFNQSKDEEYYCHTRETSRNEILRPARLGFSSNLFSPVHQSQRTPHNSPAPFDNSSQSQFNSSGESPPSESDDTISDISDSSDDENRLVKRRKV